MSKERFKIVPAVYLLLIMNGRVLLSLRKNTGWQDGNYSLVSGHLEPDETFRQAMRRETIEEIGIDIAEDDMNVVHVLNRAKNGGDWERVDIFISAEKWTGEINNTELDKCGGLDWFPTAELPENIVPYIKHVLDCVEKKIFYSEFGW